MISSINQALIFIKIQPNMSEQEKKRQRIYDLLQSRPSQPFFVYHIQKKEKIHKKIDFLRKRGTGGLNKEPKEGFLTALGTAIKKDPKTSSTLIK